MTRGVESNIFLIDNGLGCLWWVRKRYLQISVLHSPTCRHYLVTCQFLFNIGIKIDRRLAFQTEAAYKKIAIAGPQLYKLTCRKTCPHHLECTGITYRNSGTAIGIFLRFLLKLTHWHGKHVGPDLKKN